MGATLAETNSNLDQLSDLALQLQQETGVKLLWATSNLFADPLYACGASTSPSAAVFASAAAQVKKGLEMAKKLGAEGFGMYIHMCVLYNISHSVPPRNTTKLGGWVWSGQLH